jgi:integrase
MSEQMRRQRRKTLTDKMVSALPRRAKRYVLADPDQRGMYIRVMPKGPNVYAAVARDPYGKQVWATIGNADDALGIDEARDKARKAIRRIKEGKPAFEPLAVAPDTFRAVAEEWLKRHVAEKKLRSRPEIERVLKNDVYPLWGRRSFVGIKRSDIAKLLDNVQDHSGASAADHVLAIIRGIANWYATRHDDYASPFVRGMRRTDPETRTRDRVLDDDELRRVWRAAEAAGSFGALIRILLLTAQRRGAVVRMKWSDISNGVWEIATEEREKGNAGALKLPEAALAIIKAQPKFKTNKYVFAAVRGDGHLNGFNKRKTAFGKACGVTGWSLHDCRRTARSLMSRAGVSDEYAEHTLGHKLQGVKKTYNRYDFFNEKSDALAKLAALIDLIVNPLSGNVVPLKQHEAAVS